MNASVSDAPAVQVTHLAKRFGDLVAVDDVSFEVRRGEVFAFLGANGSGKSTIIRMLCGIMVPTSGRAEVLGFDTVREAEQVKQHIGYMSQQFGLYGDLTVRENLDFYAGVYEVPRNRLKQRLDMLLAMAGLTGRERQLAGTLSGGWRQRLALSCAMIHQPQLLFLDEPTAGVDAASRRQFWDLILALADSGVTVFVTTHYLDEAEHANRVSMLSSGRIVGQGTPADLKARYWRGYLLTIVCDQPQRARALLEGAPEVSDVRLYGSTVRVVTDTPESTAIRAALELAGIQVASIELVAPTLEDVFLSLVGAPNV